ncbi:hypothetical protein CBOM_03848 [Ceraceosorus bombacis]|uniref:Uncharacterized protein n=1 Tax=Ceraceosorus bombacis TaxID=401625 RepID=A0A0P1BHA5_9BASI|nr:hypothetical protein CBOM_03848 [Ceraceosorus bombacis]
MSSPRTNAISPAPSHGTAATFGHGGAPTNGSTLHPPSGGVAPARSVSGASASSRRDTVQPAAPPHVIDGPSGRLLCIADVRGNLSSLNALAREHNAQAIIHTGDFGFYEQASFDRISDRTLRHLVQYSTLISASLRQKLLGNDPSRPGAPPVASVRAQLQAQSASQGTGTLLSELQSFLSGSLAFDVPATSPA